MAKQDRSRRKSVMSGVLKMQAVVGAMKGAEGATAAAELEPEPVPVPPGPGPGLGPDPVKWAAGAVNVSLPIS
jgi:hypothetical protein